MATLKTLKDIHVANDRLITDIAKINKTTKEEVSNIVDFIGRYIAGVITKGTMESVMIPYFGKFQPKVKKVKAAAKVMANKRNGKDMLYRVVNGMKLIDKRVPDEIIRDRRSDDGETKQALDLHDTGAGSSDQAG